MSKQFIQSVRKHARHKRRQQLVSHNPNSQGIYITEEKIMLVRIQKVPQTFEGV